MTSLGALDGLAAVARPRRAPAPGEVEIEVAAAGLNFRDVLRALGMLVEYEREMGKKETQEDISEALEALKLKDIKDKQRIFRRAKKKKLGLRED